MIFIFNFYRYSPWENTSHRLVDGNERNSVITAPPISWTLSYLSKMLSDFYWEQGIRNLLTRKSTCGLVIRMFTFLFSRKYTKSLCQDLSTPGQPPYTCDGCILYNSWGQCSHYTLLEWKELELCSAQLSSCMLGPYKLYPLFFLLSSNLFNSVCQWSIQNFLYILTIYTHW